MSSTASELNHILQLSRAMLEHARREEWDALLALVSVRDTALHGCCERAVKREESASVATVLHELIEIDCHIRELSEDGKRKLSSALQQLQRDRGALNAYQRYQTLGRAGS